MGRFYFYLKAFFQLSPLLEKGKLHFYTKESVLQLNYLRLLNLKKTQYF